jgi:hypothetical protein
LQAGSTSAWASFTLRAALEMDANVVIGKLTTASARAGFDVQLADQTLAWAGQISVIQRVARELVQENEGNGDWTVLLEYPIPRREKRIDAVVVADHFVVVIEFKIGKSEFDRADLWQVQDYLLDLRDFHEASRGLHLEGVLVATAASAPRSLEIDRPTGIHKSNSDLLGDTILSIKSRVGVALDLVIDGEVWAASGTDRWSACCVRR